MGPKRATYAQLGIREYWLFDPKGEYWDRPLQGLTLENGSYRPLSARVEAGRRTLRSTVLGMDLWADESLVRFRDVGSGEVMRTWSEQRDALQQELAARAQERVVWEQERAAGERARARLEARIRELEARER